MKNILFYISGHGYGHLVRTIEIARALCRSREDIYVMIRTTAPSWLFYDLISNKNVEISESELDCGVVEVNPLEIDSEKTIEKLINFIKTSMTVVSRETAFILQHNIDLIVSDIPFLAGEIASKAGIPCLAASNFLWDWIYEPMIFDDDYRDDVLLSLRCGYSKMAHWMRYPFHHSTSMLNKITDVSLVVRKTEKSKEEVMRGVGLGNEAQRLKVYLAFRGGIDRDIVVKAAKSSPDYLFLIAEPIQQEVPENVKVIEPYPQFSFTDVINMCDLVVGKPGYGLVSNCVAHKKKLLYPPRYGFREDEIMMNEAKRFTAMLEIPREDFYAGRWNGYLEKLIADENPRESISVNGADECVKIINSYL
ncbi:MAG: hypothetical protein ACP5K7_08645 [Verrucomicrobiia bacterium]